MSDTLRLAKDFRLCVWLIWKHLGLTEPTPLQYDIARYIQKGPKRRMVQAFRGVAKSFLTAAFVIWRLLRNPNERILVISANEDRAVQFTTFVRGLIEEIPEFQHLRPRDGQRDSVMAFDVGPSTLHQSPSVRAAGIFGQITGSRASVIVADDIEVPKNSLTQTMRDRLAEAVKEFDAVLMTDADLQAIGLDQGEIVYLGTPQTEASVYNGLPERGYEIRVWPARYPADVDKYAGKLAPYILDAINKDVRVVGKSTEPGRFPEADLLARELSYGRSGFALQFMLDTSLSDMDRHPLKLRDFVVMALNHEEAPSRVVWAAGPEQCRNDIPAVGLSGDRWYGPMFYPKDDLMKYTGVVMAIDPAGRGADEMGYAVVAFLNGFLWLLACEGLTGGYSDENLRYLARKAKALKVQKIVVEPNFGDGMFNKLLEPILTQEGYPCTVEDTERSAGQKECRIIDTLEPVLNQHRLIVDEAVIRRDADNYNNHPGEFAHRYSLFWQLTRITRDRQSLPKDDRVDALALAVAYWVEFMRKDVSKIEDERMQKHLDAELRKFMVAAGRKPRKNNHFNSILGRRSV